jgi:hypothetical protein
MLCPPSFRYVYVTTVTRFVKLKLSDFYDNPPLGVLLKKGGNSNRKKARGQEKKLNNEGRARQ